jgi:succinate dehydrogenase flavin-adding protein (antitoxin of CptAB toxin-antitoxin module)
MMPYVENWLKSNTNINYSVLSNIINLKFQEFAFDFFNQKISTLSFSEMKDLSKMDFRDLLDNKENNLFNNVLIDSKLDQMSSNKKNRTIKAFNKIASKYKFLKKKTY